MSVPSNSPLINQAAAARRQASNAPSSQNERVEMIQAPSARGRFVEGHFDHADNASQALAPGRAVLLAHPEPRMSLTGEQPVASAALTVEPGVHIQSLGERFDRDSAIRLDLQRAASPSVDTRKGGHGGVSLALTNELAGLQALRKRVKPVAALPVPAAQAALNGNAAAGAGPGSIAPSLDHAHGGRPDGVRPPQDSTEDHVELKLIKAETLAVFAEISADLTVMGTGDPVGLASLMMETGASGVGLFPEAVVVVLRAVEYLSGKRLEAQAGEQVSALSHLEQRLSARETEVEGALHRADAARDDAQALRSELQQLKRLLDQVGKLKAGFEVSRAHGEQIRQHAGHEMVGPSVALVGGGAKVAGTAILAVAEHGGSHALAAAGAGTAGAAAMLMLPFAFVLTRENYRQVGVDETNLENAQSMLAATAARGDRDRSNEVSGLQRGLAKMAQARSSPNESRFKAWLFGLGMGSGVLGLASSALILAEALGAAVASAVSVVGLIGSGVGIGMGLLFVGYLVYKRLSRDTTYSVRDLQGVLTDPGSRLGLELQHRQSVKAGNQLMGQVMKMAVMKDPNVRAAVLAMARDDSPKPSLRSAIESALRAAGQPGRARDIEGAYEAHVSELVVEIEKRLGDAESIRIGFDMTQSEGALDDYAMGRLGFAVRQTLDERVRTLNSLHTPLLSQVSLIGALENALRTDAVGRQELIALLKAELPLKDERIDAVLAEAVAVSVPSDLPTWAQRLEPDTPVDAESASRDQARRQLIGTLFSEAAPDLARLAAMRKLLRRDKEALLYASVGTLQRLEAEMKSLTSDEASVAQRERAANLSAQADQLRRDFERYGVTPETLSKAEGARSVEQMVHATGLIAKELRFE